MDEKEYAEAQMKAQIECMAADRELTKAKARKANAEAELLETALQLGLGFATEIMEDIKKKLLK